MGHGIALHAKGDSSGVQCFICSEYNHYSNQCRRTCDATKRAPNRGTPHWKNSRGRGSNGGRGGCGGSAAGRGHGGGDKWCSLHNTTSHSDQECLKQKTNGNTGSANFANICILHQYESQVNTTGETTSEVTGGYMGGYSFMASTATEPAPQERPTKAREKDLSGSETLGFFGAFGGDGESTALIVIR